MNSDPKWVDFGTIERFVVDLFIRLGVPEKDAEICTNVIITADKWGIHSHGVSRLKQTYYDRIRWGIQQPVTRFEIIREGPTTAVVNGHDGMGQVIAKRSMDLAIEKAAKYGMGMVAVRNSTHYGIAGYYVLMAINAGMIGITGTNARPAVAPTFGIESMFGTNPLAFGIPTNEEFPFILDCATSTSQRGKIETYDRMGRDLPPSWVINRKGKAQTDPEKVLAGLLQGNCFLTPLGGIGEENAGHKGYGYATVVEILSAALQNGRFLKQLTGVADGKPAPLHLGHFFIAIDVSSFIDLGKFKAIVGDILRSLRSAEKLPGQSRIYTAGEKEWLTFKRNKSRGIPLYRMVQQEIIQMRDEVGLHDYDFPF